MIHARAPKSNMIFYIGELAELWLATFDRTSKKGRNIYKVKSLHHWTSGDTLCYMCISSVLPVYHVFNPFCLSTSNYSASLISYSPKRLAACYSILAREREIPIPPLLYVLALLPHHCAHLTQLILFQK